MSVVIFLNEKQSPLSGYIFVKGGVLHGLDYKADIFSHMNETNLSIQGPAVYIMDAAERLQALLAKLPIWKR